MIDYFGVSTFTDIFSTRFLLFAIIASVLNTVLGTFMARKFFQIFQQNGYTQTGYAKWTFKLDNVYITRLGMVVMLSVLAYLLICTAFSFFESSWTAYASFVFYVGFCVSYIVSDFKRKSKSRLVFTSRMIRLYATYALLYFIITALLIFGAQMIGYLAKDNLNFVNIRFGVICLTPLLVPLVIMLAGLVISPYEKAHGRKYVIRCKRTLEEAKSLIKIGITGSFGKTSVKEILKTVLSVKYKVLSTPASYNTPMGICKSVKRYDGTYDVFIAEMGARHEGDIKEVAQIVSPTYSIITGVTNQHLETFSTVENIVNTKYELVDCMREGTVVFSTNNINSFAMAQRAKEDARLKVVTAGVLGEIIPSVYADNLECLPTGSSFTLHLGGEEIKVSTVLIGKHNVSNICLAAALAHEIGMTKEEIAEGISLIAPIKHRLEILKNDDGMTVIDDSYNSNVDGTVAALDVFSSFEGRKIIVTPGLVELGRVESLENFRFGRRIAKVVDYAILVGDTNAYKIRDGLLDEGFPLDKIIMVKDLSEGIKSLSKMSKEGDVILFENDLPDKFL